MIRRDKVLLLQAYQSAPLEEAAAPRSRSIVFYWSKLQPVKTKNLFGDMVCKCNRKFRRISNWRRCGTYEIKLVNWKKYTQHKWHNKWLWISWVWNKCVWRYEIQCFLKKKANLKMQSHWLGCKRRIKRNY